ncbi:MAG: Dam family site-specific DNA-(adenine-N6)-methyltransferase [Deltaproteobacteria bacterium]|nr:Dam family site-specific DNA-(adenine-N6)-methyltransferase [Deltaproteobacteria bacterium]
MHLAAAPHREPRDPAVSLDNHLVRSVRAPAPFMKWAGGKARLIPQIEPYLPAGPLRYGEAFLGGGALFFHLAGEGRLESALLTDLSTDVYNTHRCVRDEPAELIAQLRTYESEYLAGDADERAAYFYWMRSRHPAETPMSDVERAARMLFLNRTCFNGLWRENSKGHFNAPHGRYAQPNIAQAERIAAASQALQQATLVQTDFRAWPQLVAEHGLDFVYLDPPYQPVSATSSFNAYSGGGFSARAQRELNDVLGELDALGVRWVLSNSDCAFTRELYQQWNIHTIYAARQVNSKADRRGDVAEVVVTNRRPGLRW